MSLKEQIQHQEYIISSLKKDLEKNKERLLFYKNAKTISQPQLYSLLGGIERLENIKAEGLELIVYEGEYEYILGGDGRSSAYSEKRRGVICKVVTEYYLEDNQDKIIQDFLYTLGGLGSCNKVLITHKGFK